MATYAQPAVIVLRLVHIGIASPRTQVVYTFPLLMFNKFFNNQVVRHGYSDCADRIVANVANATATVYYKNGSVYQYEGVSRRALINLIINDNISLGRWINDALLFVDSKCARTGHYSEVVAV